MKERWKAVVGFEGLYEVSDRGRVRSLDRSIRVTASWYRKAHLRRYSGQLLRPGKSGPFGYVSVVLKHGRPSVPVHHLVAAAFLGARPRGLDVRHKNGRGGDNRVSNLAYGSRAENNRDISRNGRRKVTPAQVRRIRTLVLSGKTMTELSKSYGVCRSQISNIANRKHYSHVR